MPYSEKFALTFLKEIYKDLGGIVICFEDMRLSIEQLYKKYQEFIEANPEFMRLEAFKKLEADLQEIYKTCRFVSNKCTETQYDITDCGAEIN